MIKKTLATMVLALGISGCADHSEYTFNGKIGNEWVNFSTEQGFIVDDTNILTVWKPDGRIIKYINTSGGGYFPQINKVEVIENHQITRYERASYKDVLNANIFFEAQVQFESYMHDIIDVKTSKELEKLR